MNNEGLNIEYKREYSEDIRKTVIAFANTNGGKIFIGIEDDGAIIGVSDPDAVVLRVSNVIRDSIRPDVTLFTTCCREVEGDRTVVVLTVQKGTACPYYLVAKGLRPQGVYVRQGASTVPATDAAILKMIRETSGDNYEAIRSLNQDLTFEYLEKEFREANTKVERAQMKTLGLVGEDYLFTNLGLLLSDQCSHTIKMAVFEGTSKETFKDRYEFSGSLFQQLRECYAFIDRCNGTSAEFDGLTRIDKRQYPSTAIREALLNSVVHRDYSFSGSTLISIFDDRMEMVTIGGLVKGISREDIFLGVSILRNKNLANVFYRLNLIEAYGTGIQKIMESYRDQKLQPKIEMTENAFKITLFNTKERKNEGAPQTRVISFSEGEKQILDLFCCSKALKRKDIEEELGISQAMAVRYLKSLSNKGAILKVGMGNQVRYELK